MAKSFDIFAASEKIMRMDDATWVRHANPWSVYSRMTNAVVDPCDPVAGLDRLVGFGRVRTDCPMGLVESTRFCRAITHQSLGSTWHGYIRI